MLFGVGDRSEATLNAMEVLEITGLAIQQRIDALAAIRESATALTRQFLSSEHRRANDLVAGWMSAAGMSVRTDAIGNIIGRYEAKSAGAPALLLGSHLDTVRDAGKYDGTLGVVTAIACVDALYHADRRFPFAIEVIGFGDEEGVRFGATMLGSRAVAAAFAADLLALRDNQGLTVADAMRAFGLDPDRVSDAARSRRDFLAYVELHIEQGPVLEARGLPVGCVTAIAGASRLSVEVTGRAGHAGTVPMAARADALAAAAKCITAIESRCAREPGLVGTVGVISVSPGATNVIPGAAQFTVDIRAPDDRRRQAAVAAIEESFVSIARSRGVTIASRRLHELPSVVCAGWLQDQIRAAIAAESIEPLDLASGAGHDGMAMLGIVDIAMIFVRCAGGVSHHPAEAVILDDIAAGARVLMRFIENFAGQAGS
jgi:allantoate deiminase